MSRDLVVRVMAGLALLAGALGAGALPRSPWIVVPLAVVFTVAFIVGRWRLWQPALRAQRLSRTLAGVASTLVVQTALVSVLYLIGRGLAAVLGRPGTTPFSTADLTYCGVVGLIGIGLGGLAAWRERHHPLDLRAAFADRSGDATAAMADAEPAEIRVLPQPVTLQSFFAGIHYTHARYDGPERTYNGAPNADSAGSEEKIAAAEVRLGVVLPEALRSIYLTQNGGSVNRLCVPKEGVDVPLRYEHLITPFSGYDDLLPCELLQTFFDSATDCADPDDPDQADRFPDGCAQFILLAQWYRHTLFLDYRADGEPGVGFVDFDIPDWERHCARWPTFDAFFAALRHYDDV